VTNLVPVQSSQSSSRTRRGIRAIRRTEIAGVFRAQSRGDENMLGIIAAILIILWLLGFFAFHVTSALIHIVLVVGLILLVLHFVRGSE
jgi:hypothetical protein